MKYRPDDNQIKWGVTAFCVAGAGLLLFFLIAKIRPVFDFLDTLAGILSPFFYGLVFAYLLCPLYNLCTRTFLKLFEKRKKPVKRALNFSKAISTVISLIAFLVVVVGIIWMIIPGLIDSLANIAGLLPDGMHEISKWLTSGASKIPELQQTLGNWVDNAGANITKLLREEIIPEYSTIASSISAGVFSVVNFLKNFIIGIIICIYFLNSKEFFGAQIKKLILAIFKEKHAQSIFDGATFTNKTFGGFINGKLIDSLIVGILCFIIMSIFGWHYPLLISCIIGLTNIIPFFGPFIGAIPSALLLLIVNPMECLYFIIFIIILQQVDGSIIGPKILGESTGLSSFWVMFAILVGGGLFGFLGMVIGIPVFAVLYAYFSRITNNRLRKKGFVTDLNVYKVDKYRSDESEHPTIDRLKEKFGIKKHDDTKGTVSGKPEISQGHDTEKYKNNKDSKEGKDK